MAKVVQLGERREKRIQREVHRARKVVESQVRALPLAPQS